MSPPVATATAPAPSSHSESAPRPSPYGAPARRRGWRTRRTLDELAGPPPATPVQLELPADIVERLEMLAWSWSATAFSGGTRNVDGDAGDEDVDGGAPSRTWEEEAWTVGGVVASLLVVALEEAEAVARREGVLRLVHAVRPRAQDVEALERERREAARWKGPAQVWPPDPVAARVGAQRERLRRLAEAELNAGLEELDGRDPPEEPPGPSSADRFAGGEEKGKGGAREELSAAARTERWLAFLEAYAPGFAGVGSEGERSANATADSIETPAPNKRPAEVRRGAAVFDELGRLRSVFWRAANDTGENMPSWWMREDAGTDYPVSRDGWRGVLVVLQSLGVTWRANEQPAPLNVPDLAARSGIVKMLLRGMVGRERAAWSVGEWAAYHAAGELGLAAAAAACAAGSESEAKTGGRRAAAQG